MKHVTLTRRLLIGAASAVLVLAADPILAQRGGFGGGRGRGGFPGGSPAGILQEEVVANELQLTDEQQKKIEAVIENNRVDFSQMMPLMMEMRGANSDEERAAIRQKIAEVAAAPAKKAEEELKTVLTPQQFTRYQQANRQRSGVRALMNSSESDALGLTEEQRTRLGEKAQEMFSRFRDLQGLSEEERAAEQQKMEEEVLTVLTPEQRKKWDELLGEPIEGIRNRGDSRGGRDRGGDRGGRPPQVASTPPSSTPTPSTPPSTEPATEPSAGGDPLDDMLGALESRRDAAPAMPAVDPNAATIADFGRGAADGPVESFSFNFVNAPWADVLKLFASSAGLTLDMSVTPPGAFNYYDPNTYTPSEALDVMNGYLRPRGYLLLKRDRFLVVTQIDSGIDPSLIPTVTEADLAARGGNELVRVIFETGQTPASELVSDVQSLLGQEGKAVAMGASNRLIAEGVVRDLREVRDLLQDTTRPVGPDGLAFRPFRLIHIDARDVEPLVKALLGVNSELGSASSSGSSRSSRGSSDDDRRRAFFEMMSRGRGGPPSFGGGDRGGSSSSSSSSSNGTTEAGKARVAVDDRTNTLLVTAKPSDLDIVSQAVKELDVPDSDAADGRSANDDGPMLRVYKIEEGDLSKVSETLTAMVPGIAINADDRADQLHVVATADRHREVEQLVELITGRAGSNSVAVIPLARMDAYSAGQMVANMFAADQEDTTLTVQADPTGRRLIVRGTSGEVAQVRSLLLQLGETGEAATAIPVQRGPIRELPLGGADPAETLRLLRQLWNAGHDAPLRVVEPVNSDRGDQFGSQPRGDAIDDPRAAIQNAREAYFVAQAADESVPDDSARGESGPSATIIGDRLVISSQDLDALDQLERLAGRLLEQTQGQTRWTVIYLQVATVDDAITTLQQFFPQAQIGGSTTTTVDTISPSATLRIIPESRTNALFLSGSPAEVADVQDVLRIIDASDVPTSARSRVPRSIPVQYANAAEVAEVLRDVFIDLIAQPATNQRNSRFGGGDESSTSIQPGQMTIAVDANSSRIVVSSDEALYRQVEEIVLELDEAARQARRSVRVVNLQNTNPAAVKDMLGTLLPQVSFTTSTSTSSSRSGSSSSSRSGSSGRGDDSQPSSPFDFFRRMREQREREGGGSSGGRPSFGGGGFPFGGGFGRGGGGGDRGGSDRGRGGR